MPDSPAAENLKLLLKTFDAIANSIENEADEGTRREVEKDLDNLRLLISQNQTYLDEASSRTDRAVSKASERLRREQERLRALDRKKRLSNASMASDGGLAIPGGRRAGKKTMTDAFREAAKREREAAAKRIKIKEDRKPEPVRPDKINRAIDL